MGFWKQDAGGNFDSASSERPSAETPCRTRDSHKYIPLGLCGTVACVWLGFLFGKGQ
ncbi:uncharacterized protein K460DRAFT_370981 [Cucurbitaria berberidis CBS 394.84]|uniref:Uncharacterized protein n=1 Tax=Cucurbitaria berberidis CBS 394.84 TaxID=1168544 RepID=A0A9P4L462_9PLEO|nr:uncharacterized protein K460DRAFT_370981 [Cucurbitaria berberidis CBS 394.84]KAF1840994.1 hypothetical protein K460DRAFT_370981 [Cucurbitaria berberidis CBS 394.84]